MNICMFSNTYLPHVGGVARSVAFFSQDLVDLGHKVLVVAPRFAGAAQSEEGRVGLLRVPAIQNFNGSDFSVSLGLPHDAGRKITRFRPDLIHTHHPFLLGDTALRTARRLGLPLVFTHHTLYERYTHYVPLDSKAMQRFAVHLATAYANMCTQVVAPSQSIADLIRDRGVHRPVKVIPTGVDVAFFRKGNGTRFRQAENIPRDALVIGHLGRLAPEKNLGYLSKSVGLFMQEEPTARYLVVGKGPSEKEIAQLFEEKGLSQRLTLAGERVGSDLSDAYKAMDIFVFASTSETQGMVLVEAMAAGNPVVALEAPGAREVVLDGKNGRLLPPQASPAEFSDAVREIAVDKRKRDEWGHRAIQTAEAYERKVCAGSLSALYGSLPSGPVSTEEHDHGFVAWESLLVNIRAEWDLLSQKVEALQGTVTDL